MTDALTTTAPDDTFSVFVPGVVEILEKADGSSADDTRPIGGFCSTEDLDRQGEIVVQKGLDFSEFVCFGFFNDNHKQDTHAVLGYPTLAELRGGRWWTEGNLIAGYPPADKIWELARALQKSGAKRRLGMSIEGRVLERDGRNKILRAKVRHVALTAGPVNTFCTWAPMIAKSFAEPSAVIEAAERAGLPERAERPQEISFEGAFERVRQRWPSLSIETARRAALVAFTTPAERLSASSARG